MQRFILLLSLCFFSACGSDPNDIFTSKKRREFKTTDPSEATSITWTRSDGSNYGLSFKAALEVPTSHGALDLKIHDLNDDGRLDVMALSPIEEGKNSIRGNGTLNIFMQTGNSEDPFAEKSIDLDYARRQQFLVDRFNEDEIPDILIANTGETEKEGSLTVLQAQNKNHELKNTEELSEIAFDFIGEPADPELEESAIIQAELGKLSAFAVKADWNQDGLMDMAVVDRIADHLSILYNLGKDEDGNPLYFPENAPARLDDENKETCQTLHDQPQLEDSRYLTYNEACVGREPFQMAVGQWGGDCYPDIAVLDMEDEVIYLMINRPLEGDVEHIAECPESAAAVSTTQVFGELRIFERLHNSERQLMDPIEVNESPRGIIAGDWDADQKWDLAVTRQQEEELVLLYGDHQGNFEFSVIPVGLPPRQLDAADFNQDGIADFVVGSRKSVDTGDFILVVSDPSAGSRQGYLSGRIASSTRREGSRPGFIKIIDLNQDQKLDIVTTLPFEHKLSILYQE